MVALCLFCLLGGLQAKPEVHFPICYYYYFFIITPIVSTYFCEWNCFCITSWFVKKLNIEKTKSQSVRISDSREKKQQPFWTAIWRKHTNIFLKILFVCFFCETAIKMQQRNKGRSSQCFSCWSLIDVDSGTSQPKEKNKKKHQHFKISSTSHQKQTVWKPQQMFCVALWSAAPAGPRGLKSSARCRLRTRIFSTFTVTPTLSPFDSLFSYWAELRRFSFQQSMSKVSTH